MGEPTKVFLTSEGEISLAKPKSAILSYPFLRRILAGFKSRWTILFSSSRVNAYTICLNKSMQSLSDMNLLSAKYFSKSPPLQYSIKKYIYFHKQKISDAIKKWDIHIFLQYHTQIAFKSKFTLFGVILTSNTSRIYGCLIDFWIYICRMMLFV